MTSWPVGVSVYGCEQDEAEVFRALAPRLGVVPTITSEPVSVANAMAGAGNRSVSVGHRSAVTAPMLRALEQAGVEHVSTRSIGVDHIDLAAAARTGITVENVAYAPDGVADHTLMLILMALRDARAIVSAAERLDFRLPRVRGRELRDLTVGVVGVGRIGTAVVTRLHGFGCRVLVHGHRPTAAALRPAQPVSLDELLRTSDVVTLHLPLTPETHHVIGRTQLEAMKPGALLVNTARGALVDTAELLVALEHRHLGGVALDVLEGEEGTFAHDHSTTPIEHDQLLRLQRLSNALVTPHLAYFTERALHDTVHQTLVSCLRFEGRRRHGQTQDRDLVRGLL